MKDAKYFAATIAEMTRRILKVAVCRGLAESDHYVTDAELLRVLAEAEEIAAPIMSEAVGKYAEIIADIGANCAKASLDSARIAESN